MKLSEEVRVMIVEDDFMVTEMIKGMLKDMGYTIAGTATNGQQAIELTQSLQPDVILMDIAMPNIDGIEASRQIQTYCPTPVVILTAYESRELVEQSSEAGVGAYLLKPPDAREMEGAIAIATARFGDMMKLRHLNDELQTRNAKLQTRNEQLQAALDEVKQLSGLLPICANCKKIRDDEGYWQDVAVYIRDHSEAEFSHGICPDCAKELYPGFSEEPDKHSQEILGVLKKLGWANLEDISTETTLPENDTWHYLQNMVIYGQIRQMTVQGETFYGLPWRSDAR